MFDKVEVRFWTEALASCLQYLTSLRVKNASSSMGNLISLFFFTILFSLKILTIFSKVVLTLEQLAQLFHSQRVFLKLVSEKEVGLRKKSLQALSKSFSVSFASFFYLLVTVLSGWLVLILCKFSVTSCL